MSKPLNDARVFDDIVNATQQVAVNSLQKMIAMHS
jgi:hypothetical protein